MRTATARHIPLWVWSLSAVAVLVTVTLGVSIGAVNIAPLTVWSEISKHIFGSSANLSAAESTIIWQLRLPRVLLALVVGAMLASAGCAYQGTFRNPLADPYLLGVSAGAGLGATIAIFYSSGQIKFLLPIAAFIGALAAVFLTYSLGRSAISGRSSTALVLAGVAVASLLTAIQTLLQQQNTDKIREVYAWVLGRLSTSGWNDLLIITPYVAICILVLLRYRRVLDVFAVGDEEAQTMGLPVSRARGAIIVAASLGTAAAVSVTGLIGFVGIIVPHILRLIVGNSYRILLPLSVVYGGIFLVLADIFARTVLAPQEISIGVVTALLGAPFFLFVLGSSKNGSIT
jgi:iron complex transport system permease protein